MRLRSNFANYVTECQVLYGREVETYLVKSFSRKEQQYNTKSVKKNQSGNYLLYNTDNTEFDTTGKLNKCYKDALMFIISLDGKLIAYEHSYSKGLFHVSLASHKPVLCAVMIKVKNGKFIEIINNSGHYWSYLENVYNAFFC